MSEPTSVESVLEEARFATEIARHKRVIDLLEAGLRRFPDSGELFVELSAACLRQDRAKSALRAAEAALALGENAAAARLRTASLLRMNRTREALAAARDAARIAPNSAPVVADLALAALCAGDRGVAAAQVHRASSLDPGDATVLHVTALVALGDERWHDAEAATRAALSRGPSNLVALRNNLALALVAQGRPDDARGMLRSVQEASLRTEHARVVHRNLRQLGGIKSRAGTNFFTGGGAYTPARLLVFMGFILVFMVARALWYLLPFLIPIVLALLIRGMLRGTHDDRRTFAALPANTRVTVRARVAELQASR